MTRRDRGRPGRRRSGSARAPGSRPARRLRRRAFTGFVVGFAITVPAAVLALAHPLGESLKPYLLPGLLLLGPFTDELRGAPGLVGVSAGALANGLVGAVVGAATTFVQPHAGPTSPRDASPDAEGADRRGQGPAAPS